MDVTNSERDFNRCKTHTIRVLKHVFTETFLLQHALLSSVNSNSGTHHKVTNLYRPQTVQRFIA